MEDGAFNDDISKLPDDTVVMESTSDEDDDDDRDGARAISGKKKRSIRKPTRTGRKSSSRFDNEHFDLASKKVNDFLEGRSKKKKPPSMPKQTSQAFLMAKEELENLFLNQRSGGRHSRRHHVDDDDGHNNHHHHYHSSKKSGGGKKKKRFSSRKDSSKEMMLFSMDNHETTDDDDQSFEDNFDDFPRSSKHDDYLDDDDDDEFGGRVGGYGDSKFSIPGITGTTNWLESSRQLGEEEPTPTTNKSRKSKSKKHSSSSNNNNSNNNETKKKKKKKKKVPSSEWDATSSTAEALVDAFVTAKSSAIKKKKQKKRSTNDDLDVAVRRTIDDFMPIDGSWHNNFAKNPVNNANDDWTTSFPSEFGKTRQEQMDYWKESKRQIDANLEASTHHSRGQRSRSSQEGSTTMMPSASVGKDLRKYGDPGKGSKKKGEEDPFIRKKPSRKSSGLKSPKGSKKNKLVIPGLNAEETVDPEAKKKNKKAANGKLRGHLQDSPQETSCQTIHSDKSNTGNRTLGSSSTEPTANTSYSSLEQKASQYKHDDYYDEDDEDDDGLSMEERRKQWEATKKQLSEVMQLQERLQKDQLRLNRQLERALRSFHDVTADEEGEN